MDTKTFKHAAVATLLAVLVATVAAPSPRHAGPAAAPAEMAQIMPSVVGGEEWTLEQGGDPLLCRAVRFVGQYAYTIGSSTLTKWDCTSWTSIWNVTNSYSFHYPFLAADSDGVYVFWGKDYPLRIGICRFMANGALVWNVSLDTSYISGIAGIRGMWNAESVLYVTGIKNETATTLLQIDKVFGLVLWNRTLTGACEAAVWGDSTHVYVAGMHPSTTIWKYDAAGDLVWTRTGSAGVTSICGNGTYFYTGGTTVAKWTTDGTRLWEKNCSVPGHADSFTIEAIDASTGAVFGVRDHEPYVYKWRASDGAFLWIHEYQDSTRTQPRFINLHVIGSAVYTCGYFGDRHYPNGFLLVRWHHNGFSGNASFTASPSPSFTGRAVGFSAPADVGDAPIQYQWNFGDGSPNATDSAPSHAFTSVGVFTVKLHVRDVEGDVASHAVTLHVYLPDGDEDGDGMRNAWEIDYSFDVTDPADAAPDIDGDGATNRQEHDHGSDPRNRDTDWDGLEDGREINELGTNPTKWDTDWDGLGDGREVDELGTDPTKWDTDGDGWSDLHELGYSDPTFVLSFPVYFFGIKIPAIQGLATYAFLLGLDVLVIFSIVRPRLVVRALRRGVSHDASEATGHRLDLDKGEKVKEKASCTLASSGEEVQGTVVRTGHKIIFVPAGEAPHITIPFVDIVDVQLAAGGKGFVVDRSDGQVLAFGIEAPLVSSAWVDAIKKAIP